MPLIIRPMTSADVITVSIIIQHSLGDTVQIQHIQQVIAEDDHASFVAVDNGQMVGFVDGFLTMAQDKTRRWELDLLAVHPDFQGRGAGKQLIQAFSDGANDYGATLVRALVAIDNKPMQTAMTKAGYQQQPNIYELHISSAAGKRAKPPENAHLIPVNTFTYRGIWLEGEISLEAIYAANAIREKYDWDVVGTVVSKTNHSALGTICAAEFDFIKCFHWWCFTG
ncbi:MAG: GNAT family N-acetyltransferase [Anaerolineae bacterium]|nr:GNAT family N-acetyltransferase [Anaerolineae bacterium]MDQ7034572.1 GNAT family N-acetyltransferase [Anaerolineae bacterium]